MKKLEYYALCWLRFQRRCEFVLWERSPRENKTGRPDMMGVLSNRHWVEIEIKRSMSDFRANRNKRCEQLRGLLPEHFPRQYYFLVPHEIADKVLVELPQHAGLMRSPHEDEIQQLYVVQKAPINDKAERLSILECRRMIKMMCNQIFTCLDEKNPLDPK